MKIFSTSGYAIPNIFQGDSTSSSVCILAHGITAEKTEGGIFSRQADILNSRGIATLQFDFLGHGDSAVPSCEMSISNETKDLMSVIDAMSGFADVSIIAASFGAVPTGFLPKGHKNRISRLCLWNPVISLKRTFVEPELPWQTSNFGRQRLEKALAIDGQLSIDGSFRVGRKFIEEILSLDVEEQYAGYQQPMIVLHGDRDTYVSFDVARGFCEGFTNRKFFPIIGSEHGFGRVEDEAKVVEISTSFLLEVA